MVAVVIRFFVELLGWALGLALFAGCLFLGLIAIGA